MRSVIDSFKFTHFYLGFCIWILLQTLLCMPYVQAQYATSKFVPEYPYGEELYKFIRYDSNYIQLKNDY